MPLAQFLLPGETLLYESPDEVYYRRSPFGLYVTGERLLLYAGAGRLSSGERAVAEPLAGIEAVGYSEAGVFTKRGRLDVRFLGHTLSLTGSPATIMEVWRVLQQHAPARGGTTFDERGGTTFDEDVTLVAPPPPPLFDDQPYPPARVEPLSAVATAAGGRKRPPSLRPLVIAAAACLAGVIAVAALYWQRSARPATDAPPIAGETGPPAPNTPAPPPTPVTVRVMDEVFSLEEGSHRALKFSVPAGEEKARISGGFRVTGGSYVDFFLMRQEQYDRFASGGEPDITSVVYRAEQWNARVGERLTPGDYYLVFDNRDEEAGEQTIAAEFFLVYEPVGATH